MNVLEDSENWNDCDWPICVILLSHWLKLSSLLKFRSKNCILQIQSKSIIVKQKHCGADIYLSELIEDDLEEEDNCVAADEN